MAGPGLNGEQIILMQSALISRACGTQEKEIDAATQLDKQIFSLLQKISDNELAGSKISRLLIDYSKKRGTDSTPYNEIKTRIDLQVKSLTSPWFRTFLRIEPVDYLSKVKCPLLALNGSLDLQVPPHENLEAIEKALIFGGNPNYRIEEIPGLNHLFQTATRGTPAEYGKIEETLSPVVLELIATWVKSNLVTK